MLTASIGTGTSAGKNYNAHPDEMNPICNATKSPGAAAMFSVTVIDIQGARVEISFSENPRSNPAEMIRCIIAVASRAFPHTTTAMS
jgi:hypothetical protein